jgi:hypothetical protein
MTPYYIIALLYLLGLPMYYRLLALTAFAKGEHIATWIRIAVTVPWPLWMAFMCLRHWGWWADPIYIDRAEH